MTITTSYGGLANTFDAGELLEDVKRSVVYKDLPAALRVGKGKGFPANRPEDYDLLVRNRGRQQRRQLRTIAPRFLKIGTAGNPLEFLFVSGFNQEAMKDAAILAISMLRRTAPVRSGKYKSSFGIAVDGRQVTIGGLRAMTLTQLSTIYVGPDTPYAVIIETGFYKRYYQTRTIKGGIHRPVAKEIRARYGDDVAAKFAFVGAVGGRGTLPVIMISAPAGAALGRDATPGAAAAKARRRRKRG